MYMLAVVPFVFVCVCLDRDSGDLSFCCVVVVVWTAAVSSVVPMTVRRRMGFQTQKRKGYMSSQVRKEEPLATASTIDGRKET